MTPAPVVVEERTTLDGSGSDEQFGVDRQTPTPPEPISRRRTQLARPNSSSSAAHAERETATEVGEPGISYHPPHRPPASVSPPAPTATFSVAPEYDPRAPTKPKFRRGSTVPPPPPLLFGLDRMLVWGMVLGGIFVASIIILVHKLTPAGQASHRDWVQTRDVTPQSGGLREPAALRLELSARVPQSAIPSPQGIGLDSQSLASVAASGLNTSPTTVPSSISSKARRPPRATTPRSSKPDSCLNSKSILCIE